MGTWGPGIFSDDLALDVRDVWRAALMDGLDDAAATARVLEELGEVFENEEEAVVGWLALAAAQHETGRLQPEARERALGIIDAGADLERWRDEAGGAHARKRERALTALAEKLRGPQPPPRTPKRPKPMSTRLQIGDVVHIRGERGEALYIVVELIRLSYGTSPVVVQLLWDGGAIPDHETLARLPLLHEEKPISLTTSPRPVQHLTVVDGPSRGKRALSNFGRVVAQGVLRPDAADVLRDQSRGFADGPSVSGADWASMAAFIGGSWHQRLVDATRRLYGL
jgi:hypothetical protein